MKERAGHLSIKGKPLTWLGEEIKAGQKAPDYRVRTGFGPEATVTLADSKGKIRIISVAPSLDTGVCEMQAIRFNQEVEKLGADIEVHQITVDLPPAMTRFCNTKLNGSVKIKTFSDYAERSFGQAYGFLIKEWQTLGRGIVIIDKNDTVAYVEYCPKIEELPNFDVALAALKGL
ncbi:MAG TPA: thiol peroxidase [bacterium]|nr:thiol peroxidase [bacterium]HMW35190.1 thiol peroxidase [bacterium]HMY37220.1 thiol peroxidase [bacterium]HMZ03855.1 thiol peroxidase [bacterium]HNB08942.1 thiol peroxidase [bacterium]